MLISDLVVFEVRENSIGFDLKANIKPRLEAVNSGGGRHNHVILHHEFLKDIYIDIATVSSDSSMAECCWLTQSYRQICVRD
jgi:hypothetical protein